MGLCLYMTRSHPYIMSLSLKKVLEPTTSFCTFFDIYCLRLNSPLPSPLCLINLLLLCLIPSQVVACLALLGGFTETLKPGVEVQKVNSNNQDSTSVAMIISTSEDSALVNLDFHGNLIPVQVPKRRIEIFDKLHQESKSLFMSLSSDIIAAMLQGNFSYFYLVKYLTTVRI